MRRHVLIVDDSPVLRRVVARSLAIAGVELAALYQAENGREGLRLIEAHPIDLVLADVNMPVMSGIELVQALATSGALARLSVIMLSSDRSAARIATLMNLGASAYLTKPFRPEALRDALAAIPLRSSQ